MAYLHLKELVYKESKPALSARRIAKPLGAREQKVTVVRHFESEHECLGKLWSCKYPGEPRSEHSATWFHIVLHIRQGKPWRTTPSKMKIYIDSALLHKQPESEGGRWRQHRVYHHFATWELPIEMGRKQSTSHVISMWMEKLHDGER